MLFYLKIYKIRKLKHSVCRCSNVKFSKFEIKCIVKHLRRNFNSFVKKVVGIMVGRDIKYIFKKFCYYSVFENILYKTIFININSVVKLKMNDGFFIFIISELENSGDFTI